MTAWTDLETADRARASLKALRTRGDSVTPPGQVPLGCEQASVVTRDLAVWLTSAGSATAADVADALGLGRKQVHRILARLAPWGELGPKIARAVAAAECPVPPGTQVGWYGLLRLDGWPWRRSGQAGNRGGGARRATCRSTTTPPSSSSG